jgi:hypothetical protein
LGYFSQNNSYAIYFKGTQGVVKLYSKLIFFIDLGVN